MHYGLKGSNTKFIYHKKQKWTILTHDDVKQSKYIM